MEIILLRHGKPKVDLKGSLSAEGFKHLVFEYARSGIQDTPPKNLSNLFKSHYAVCSDLLRSVESAKRLGLKKIRISDAIFKETDIPYFDKSFLKLPVYVWVLLSRLLWLFGFSKNGESISQAKARSKQAAKKLIEITQENKKTIVVGHGLMNHLIGSQLKKEGWKASGKTGKNYWEFRKYTLSIIEP